ncbi:DUF6879 family protein [Nonomuraea longicatena]|uniref:DUF6879 family protein n=1 Tax=Nonomuraea longicatena TaxID=83682 RepID=UPI003CD05D59
MFDDTTVVAMRYDPEGRFMGAERLPNDRTSEYISYRETAMRRSEPFSEFWKRHGET